MFYSPKTFSEDAITELSGMLEQNPAYLSSLYMIGSCYEQMEDWKNALKYYNEYFKKGKLFIKF